MKMKNNFIISLLIVFLLVGIISAWEFDNVKSYDSKDRIATITNSFLGIPTSEIATIQLKSAQNVQVGLGYQKVFEYEINSYTDYNSFIKEMEIYNVNRGNSRENKQIDLKYLTYKEIEINDYKLVCDDKIEYNPSKNSFPCKNEIIGTHKEQQEVWNDLSSMNIKAEKITIGGFTEVQQGDYYEWIPNFAGIKVSEWATWAGNISVNLVAYYKLDSSLFTDSVGTFHGTNSGTVNAAGIVLDGRDFEQDDLDEINFLGGIGAFTTTDFSVNVWTNPETATDTSYLGSATGGWAFYSDATGNLHVGSIGVDGGPASGQIIYTTGWQMLTLVYDQAANQVYYYFNGTADTSNPGAYATTFSNTSKYIGVSWHGGRYGLADGIIDEVGVWDRKLTAAEITILYNSGNACAYGNETCYELPLVVSLNSPANMTNATSQTNVFSATANEVPNTITNVSLYLNGTVNGTNTSGLAGVYNFSRVLADGAYLWKVGGCNSTGSCMNASARQLNIDSVNPTIFISYGNGTLPYRNATFLGGNQTINYTITDTNLDRCWMQYNSTNTTTPCTSGAINTTNITMQWNLWNATLWANDTFGQTVSQFFNWTYTIFENNVTYVNPVPGGGIATFGLNLTYPNTFTGITVKANFNNTNYTMSTADAGYTQTYAVSATAPLVSAATNKTLYFIILLTNTTGTFYYNSSNFTVTINPFIIGNCSVYNDTLFNFSMVDEETLAEMDGTILMNMNLYAYGTSFLVGHYNMTFTYYSGVHNASVCALNNSLTYTNYTAAYIIQHFGNTDYYFKKYRIIQNMTLNNETNTQNITLYNIKFAQTSSRTDSQINSSVQGAYNVSSYGSVGNQTSISQNLVLGNGFAFETSVVGNLYSQGGNKDLLIEVQKYYIGEDVYRLIEGTVTNTDGSTILHLVPDSESYNFVISKNGVIFGTFNSYKVICSNKAAGQCDLLLNLAQSTASLPDFTNYAGLTGVHLLDNTTSTLSFTFATTDGNAHTINQVVYKPSSGYGIPEVIICNTTTLGTSGTFSCVIPVSYRNTTFVSQVLNNGKYAGSTTFSFSIAPNMFGVDKMIEMMMFTCLVLMMLSHPILIIIGAVLGITLSIILLTFGGASTGNLIPAIIFYILGGAIIIWKISKNM